jgi:4-oxalocrotonate tautomerase
VPAITIQSLELRDSQKKILAEKFTQIFSELTNVPQDMIYVFFDGYKLNDTARGSFIFAENPPARLVAKFNEEAK